MNRRLFISLSLPIISFLSSCSFFEDEKADVAGTLKLQLAPFKSYSEYAEKTYESKAEAHVQIEKKISLDSSLTENQVIEKFLSIRDQEFDSDDVVFLQDPKTGNGFIFSKFEVAILRLFDKAC